MSPCVKMPHIKHFARKEIIRENKQIQSNNGINNNNGTCGGSSEELSQVLDQWGLVLGQALGSVSAALFGIVRSQGEVSTGLGVWQIILSKIPKIKQKVNSQAKLVSAKRRK